MHRGASRLLQSSRAWTRVPREMKKRIRFGEATSRVEEWQRLGIREQDLPMHTACCVCYTLHTIVYTLIEWTQCLLLYAFIYVPFQSVHLKDYLTHEYDSKMKLLVGVIKWSTLRSK